VTPTDGFLPPASSERKSADRRERLLVLLHTLGERRWLILATAAGRDVARIDPPARDALRLGAYQLLYTRVPAHAAVNQTVDLVRSVAPGAAGFANAVMRTIAETGLDAWLTRLAPAYDTDPIGHLAVQHNHPEWIVRAFAEALGGDLDDTARLLIEDNQPAPVHLCARPGRVDAVDLADEVGRAAPTDPTEARPGPTRGAAAPPAIQGVPAFAGLTASS